MAFFPVKLLPENQQGRTTGYVFALNPSAINRSRASSFADVGLAGWDGSNAAPTTNVQWTGARPQSIAVTFVLHSVGEDHVEAEITALEAFMDKDGATGEPPILRFVEGPKVDRVQVESLAWNVKLWTPKMERQYVDCQMSLKVIQPYKP